MARPGLLTHRKFIRLARKLGSDALAMGHLEIIWQACYESGDANVGSAEDMEYLARWHGESGQLASVMVETGFIDVDESGLHHVHDLYDHAPDYVQRRMEREQERRNKGITIKELRAKAGRASGEARRKQTGTHDEHMFTDVEQNNEHMGTNVATPAPAPAPAQNTPIVPKGTNGYCKSFEEWWTAYPKKTGKDAAYKAWKKAGAKIKAAMVCTSDEAAAYLLKVAAEYAAARAGEDQQFTPHPATWLNRGCWNDDRATWKSQPKAESQQPIRQPTLSFEAFAAQAGSKPPETLA